MVTIRRVRTVAILAFAAFGMACSSGGSNSSSQNGQFVDSEARGLRYVGDTFSGTTDALGRYRYETGDQVCFFLGQIPLGCGDATGVFTPIDLFEGAASDDCRVQNVVRFLLSLDADGDPDNGLDLRGIETVASDADDIAFDLDPAGPGLEDCDFGSDADVLAFVDEWGFDGDLVGEEEAGIHFDESLEESDYFEQALLGRWMYTATEFGGPVGARTLDITDQTLDEIGADVSEEGEVAFELAPEEPGDACEHNGALEGRSEEFIFGAFECGIDEPVAALVVELNPNEFRMDRLDPDVEYATSDLLGEWFLLTFFSDHGVFIDEATLDDISADVSASGAVSFEATADLGGEGELCQFDGQMNAIKDFVSGSVACPESGDGFFTMRLNDVVIPE